MLSNNQKCLKIGDFGTARDELIMMTRGIGTPLYMAPEVFGTSSYTSKCDVYSFGITLCEMYTRRRPYEGRWDDAMLMVKIRNGLRPTMHDDDVMVSEQMRSIIKR
jgi:mitogen-activated protein kinase kinase kinase 7